MTHPHHAIEYVEIGVADAERARRFGNWLGTWTAG